MGVYGVGVCRAQVHETNHRRVLVDPEMRPIPVVVFQVLAEQPPKSNRSGKDGWRAVVRVVLAQRDADLLGAPPQAARGAHA